MTQSQTLIDDLIDPEMRAIIDLFPGTTLSAETLPAVRAAMPQAGSVTLYDANVCVEQLFVECPAGGPSVRVMAYRPHRSEGPLPALVHMHGGGYVAGHPEMSDAANRALADTLDCAIFSVDYRVAPETVYPGALDDCFAVLCWLIDGGAGPGVDPSRIGVKGESAGGGLAAALALLARDRGLPALLCQHLTYPMLDDRTCIQKEPNLYAGAYVWTPACNQFGWHSMLGRMPGSPAISPYAAPARAHDFTGLPPCFMAVGAMDLFLEENMEYTRRLARAGVSVELHVYPGACHGFVSGAGAVAQAARQHAVSALARLLHN